MNKKRKHFEECLMFGFISMTSNGIEKLQCALCYVVFSGNSTKPSKLKRHLGTNHFDHAGKDLQFVRRLEASLKRQRIDFTGSFQQGKVALIQACYEVCSCRQPN